MLTAAVSGGVGCGMDSASDELACCEMTWFRNGKISGRGHQLSASRILLLDLMFASSQMNTQRLIWSAY